MPAAPIPYHTTLSAPAAHQLVRIERVIPVGALNQKRKCDVIKISNETHPEAIIRSIVSFQEACATLKLNITTGADRFTFIAHCFGGAASDTWELVLVEVPLRMLPAFELAIRAMIAHYTEETCYHDQKEMMNTSKKPYHMGVREFATHMAYIMLRMSLLPGAPGAGVAAYDDEEKKVAFERAMPEHWRTEWNKLGINILDPGTTLTRIVSFFLAQEREELKLRARNSAAARGRGRLYRGGRGQPYRQPALPPYHRGGHTWVPAAAAAPALPPAVYAGHSQGRRGFARGHHAAGRGG